MAGKGFGALSKLRGVEAKPQEQETEKTRNLEIQETRNLEAEDRWDSLGTEVRVATKRRLKAYAGKSGQKVKNLVDRAVNELLDREGAEA